SRKPWPVSGPRSPLFACADVNRPNSMSRIRCLSDELSKPWQVGKSDASRMHMHAPKLRAAVQRWKHLARIEQALVVECAFEPLLLIEIGFRKHRRHQVPLLDADAVLAGQYAAYFDAKPQNIGTELLDALALAGLVGVVEKER